MVRDKSKSEAPAEPVTPHEFSDAELAQLSIARGNRPMIPPDELRRLTQERKQYLGAVLQAINNGRDHRPPDMVAQYRFEMQMLLSGRWYPTIKKPRGRDAQVAEAIIGAPGFVNSPQSVAHEDHVDAILES